jgi:hypothetical protein
MKNQIFSIIALFVLGFATTHVTAATDYAMSFSKDGQGIQVPDSDSLDVDGPLTIEAWVYAESSIYGEWYNFIVSKNMNGTGYALETMGSDVEKVIRFESFGNDEADTAVQSDFHFPPNQWMHITAVWSDNSTPVGLNKLYVNGLLVSESVVQQPPTPNAEDLFIGHSPFGDTLNWKGAIDEVRIWNVERTQAEIYQDMYTKPAKNQPGLVAYWDFNDNPKKAVVIDKSGNNNNGVLFSNGASPDLPKMIKSNRPSLLNRPIN